MTDLWRLREIAHDRSEIPAGEFLEELEALLGRSVTQQTLSNYVARGCVDRKRIDTAPGGRGQTGYFERRMLVPALVAAAAGRTGTDQLALVREEATGNTAEYVVRCLATFTFARFPEVLTAAASTLKRQPTWGDFFRLRGQRAGLLAEVIGTAHEPTGSRRQVAIDMFNRNKVEQEFEGRLIHRYRALLREPATASDDDAVATASDAFRAEQARAREDVEAILDLLRLRPLPPRKRGATTMPSDTAAEKPLAEVSPR